MTLRAEQEWRKHWVYAFLVLAAIIYDLFLHRTALSVVLWIALTAIEVLVFVRLVIIRRARENPVRQTELTKGEVTIRHGALVRVIRLSDSRYFLGSPAWDIHGFLLPRGEWCYVQDRNGPCFAVAPSDSGEWQHALETLGVPCIGRLYLWRKVGTWTLGITLALIIGCTISTIVGWLIFQHMFGDDELAALAVAGGVSGVLTWAMSVDRARNGGGLATCVGSGFFAGVFTCHGLMIAEAIEMRSYICSVSIGLVHVVACHYLAPLLPSSVMQRKNAQTEVTNL